MSLLISEPTKASRPEPRYLGGPVSDFLFLGGASLVLFPIMWLLPEAPLAARLASVAFWLQLVVNWPHFAVSYRIFYERFGQKVSGVGQSDPTLRFRYVFAGVIAPALLIAASILALTADSSRALTYGYNVMGFFVGWHYVKQGYGMAMLDSALKKRFMSGFDKKVLLANGYVAWAFSWASGNQNAEPFSFYGETVNRFDLADPIAWASGAALVVTTALTAVVLVGRLRRQVPTAWIGVAAYLVTLYVWMWAARMSPLFVLFVPTLHSLQYLWVVRRFQTNRHAASADTARSWRVQFVGSVVLGVIMFAGTPLLLSAFVRPEVAIFGSIPFWFVCVVFINIHHYFLDNVMWRRGNPAVSQHLFA